MAPCFHRQPRSPPSLPLPPPPPPGTRPRARTAALTAGAQRHAASLSPFLPPGRRPLCAAAAPKGRGGQRLHRAGGKRLGPAPTLGAAARDVSARPPAESARGGTVGDWASLARSLSRAGRGARSRPLRGGERRADRQRSVPPHSARPPRRRRRRAALKEAPAAYSLAGPPAEGRETPAQPAEPRTGCERARRRCPRRGGSSWSRRGLLSQVACGGSVRLHKRGAPVSRVPVLPPVLGARPGVSKPAPGSVE